MKDMLARFCWFIASIVPGSIAGGISLELGLPPPVVTGLGAGIAAVMLIKTRDFWAHKFDVNL